MTQKWRRNLDVKSAEDEDGRTTATHLPARARRATDGAECIGGVESGGDVKGRPPPAA